MNHLTMSASRRCTAVICVAFMTVYLCGTALAQGGGGSSLKGIEKWMRGCQLRANVLQHRTIQWPGCCSNGMAPAFPPDRYYEDALEDNPQLAMKLVAACHAEFFREHHVNATQYNPLPTYFVKTSWSGSPTLQDHPITADTEWAIGDMASYGLVVTPANFASAFSSLQQDLQKLQAMLHPCTVASEQSISTNDGPGCSTTGCDASNEAAFYAARDAAWGCATSWTSYGGGGMWCDQQATRRYDGIELCWTFQELRGVNGHLAADLSAFAVEGTAKVYIAGYKHCDGPGPDCPIPDSKLARTDLSEVATWQQYEAVSLPRTEAWQSETLGYQGSTPPLTYSPTDVPGCSVVTSGSITTNTGRRAWWVEESTVLVVPEWDKGPVEGSKKCGDDCGQCVPGQPQVALGGSGKDGTWDAATNVYWPLGKVADGHSAGYLHLFSASVTSAAATPAGLIPVVPARDPASSPDPNLVDVLSDGEVRQFVTNFVIADARPISGSAGLALKFYHRSQGTAPSGSAVLWTLTGSPFAQSDVTFTAASSSTPISVPRYPTTTSATAGAKFRLVATGVGAGTWEFVKDGADWLLASGIGSGGAATALEARLGDADTSVTPNDRLNTHLIMEPSGTIVFREVDRWHLLPWGAEITEHKVGVEGSELVTSRAYWTDPAKPGYGRLAVESDPYGNWRYFDYDTLGRVSQVASPFKNGSLDTTNGTTIAASVAANRSETFTYSSVDVNADSFADEVQERVELVQGIPVTRTYTVQFAGTTTRVQSGVGFWTIRCESAVAPSSVASFLQSVWSSESSVWGSTSHDVSESIREADYPYRALSTLAHDSAFTWNTFTDSGLTAPVATRVTTRTGRLGGSSPDYVTAGTKRVTDRNSQGAVLSSQTTDLASGQVIVHTSTDSADIDEYGRATRVEDHISHLKSEVHYSCCGVDWTRDERGNVATYEYDALRRVVAVHQQVGMSGTTPLYLTSLTEYDAAGRVKTVKRQGTDAGTPLTVASSTYDLAGRLTQSDNAEGSSGRTTYAESYDGTSHITTRTETLPESVVNVRKYNRDGSLASVNASYSATTSGSPPEQYDYGTWTDSGTDMTYQFTRRHNTSASISSLPTPWTASYTDPLGRVVSESSSIGASAIAYHTTVHHDHGRSAVRADPDGVSTITVSGRGTADATFNGANIFGSSIPTGVAARMVGQWTLTVQDLDQDGVIDISATSGHADRMTLSGSWITTKTVGSNTFPVRHSSTIVWNDDTSASSFVETAYSDATLDGLESWSTTLHGTTHSVTTIAMASGVPTGTVTTTTTDPTGAVTVSVSKFGRQESVERTNADSTFGGKSVTDYDTLGRVSRTHLLRTTSASLNGVDDDATDILSYDLVDRVTSQKAPSPTSGTTTTDRVTTSYTYDHLGRVTDIEYPSSKHTTYTYHPGGQVKAVRGFGVNPVDYDYNERGQMVTLSTYQDVSDSGTKATTTWEYSSYSGRLEAKKYHGHSDPDLSYSYTDGGRLATRTGGRGIVTTYGYANGGDLQSVEYNDEFTTPVYYVPYNRLGQPAGVFDNAGMHTLTYADDGRLIGDTITENYGSPSHLNGTGSISTLGAPSGTNFGDVRLSYQTLVGTTAVNEVSFEYDAAARINRVVKSGADALYTYDPITGQVAGTTYRKDTGSVYVARIAGTRTFDRLGRLKVIDWTNSAATAMLAHRGCTYDAHGRRTVVNAAGSSKDENWAYGYDDIGQLTSAGAHFTDTASTEVRGSQFAYAYDHIGNRNGVTQGDSTNNTYLAEYEANPLNQYTGRTVPGLLEVSGHSPAAAVYVYAGGTPGDEAYRFSEADGYFHQRLTMDNSSGPVKAVVNVAEVPGGVTSTDVMVPDHAESFTYDADGNLESDGLWMYTWDAENRFVAMQLKEDIGSLLLGASDYWLRLEFAYDHMGRRISKRVMRTSDDLTTVEVKNATFVWGASSWQKFIYDVGSWNLSAVIKCDAETGAFTASDVDQTFAWGPDLSGTEQGAGGIGGLAIYRDDGYDINHSSTAIGPMFPLYDVNGNVIMVYDSSADSSGVPSMKAAYKYGPFGEDRGRQGPIEANRFPFRWSTKYTDNETGLSYYGYRYYSAGMGRWTSRDPLAESGGLGLMCFVENSPVMKIDGLGLQPEKKCYGWAQSISLGISGSSPTVWLLPGVGLYARLEAELSATLSIENCRPNCCNRDTERRIQLTGTAGFKVYGGVGGQGEFGEKGEPIHAYGWYGARIYGGAEGIEVSAGGLFERPCESGDFSGEVEFCTQARVIGGIEGGAELQIQLRRWMDVRVGAVIYGSVNVEFGFCGACNPSTLSCRMTKFSFGNGRWKVGMRACIFMGCLDIPLGEGDLPIGLGQ